MVEKHQLSLQDFLGIFCHFLDKGVKIVVFTGYGKLLFFIRFWWDFF